MSRTYKKINESGASKRTYKRQRSLAQQFLDEYKRKNEETDYIDLYSM